MIWKESDSDREVRETIYDSWNAQPKGYEDMTPEQKANALLDYWNSTCRPHEKTRSLVRIELPEPVETEKTKRTVIVHISTFAGMAMNAEHYYAELRAHPYRNVEEAVTGVVLMHTLTQKEAMYLNKKDDGGFFTGSMGLKRGDETTRFDTIEQIKKEAIKVFNKEFADDFAVLIMPKEGNSFDRFEILDGDERIISALDKCINEDQKFKVLNDYGFETYMLE